MALADRTFMPNAIADIGALDDAFRKHVAALFPVPQRRGVGSRWGFKETRYGIDIAFFLEKLFPGARFIHLVRHAANCLSSMRRLEADGMWQREWTDQAIGNWLSINRGFLDSSDQLRHYLLVRYEDLEGSEKEFQVDRIERFIGVQPTSLDRAALARHEVAGQKALVSAHTNGVSQREADSSSSSSGGGGGGSSNSESGYGVWR